MKTLWGNPVHVIPFIRTLMVVLAVAACTVAAEDVETLRKKAEAGDSEAQRELSIIYGRGEGVPKDVSESLKWYGKTIEQGDAEAQFNLGRMYSNLTTDYAEAVKWYRMAAEQGYVDAQSYLGLMYARGMNVPKDDAESFKWFRMAAEQGDFIALGRLGRMYDLGTAVPEDDVAAYAWYSLAAAKFRSWTADLDRIQRELSPAVAGMISSSGKRARSCFSIRQMVRMRSKPCGFG
jgi:TPR repeat protein